MSDTEILDWLEEHSGEWDNNYKFLLYTELDTDMKRTEDADSLRAAVIEAAGKADG